MPDHTIPTPLTTVTAFAGFERIARGAKAEVLAQLRQRADPSGVLLFDDLSGALIDIDLREEVPCAPPPTPTGAAIGDEAPRSVGRPKLGVVAREITLLPRHWDWLNRQPGGASVALRKLVEEARRIHQGQDTVREAREAAYRFMSAIASNLEGFEEAARALFAGDQARFAALAAAWPEDIGAYLQALAAASWGGDAAR
ncbi:DUF2239 family protein [Acidovorax sp. SRB_24]|uniref:DUF2239 family protein n=1 Tax=Acidovorax sp. SRB_24 TaxID=1962700 RepID=UPI00145C6B5B|nr:DUF2239 family protein [Acidovorax sp. SRB_24]NMM78590.1 hypothetical protein [Acidovorax sp. SRB_24]